MYIYGTPNQQKSLRHHVCKPQPEELKYYLLSCVKEEVVVVPTSPSRRQDSLCLWRLYMLNYKETRLTSWNCMASCFSNTWPSCMLFFQGSCLISLSTVNLWLRFSLRVQIPQTKFENLTIPRPNFRKMCLLNQILLCSRHKSTQMKTCERKSNETWIWDLKDI